MALTLPAPIGAYFAAQSANDAHALAQTFAEDGVVHDEGGAIEGRAAIAAWMTEAKRKYRHVSEPVSSRVEADKVVVSAKVTGDFPGSPVNLDHFFELADGKIVSLSIH